MKIRTRFGVLAFMLALLSLVAFDMASCSVPSRPSWWPHASANVAAASATRVRLGHAKPSSHQLGIDIYWSQGTLPAATVHADAVRIINYVLSLHANSISLSFPFYTQGLRSSSVYVSKTDSPSAAQVGVLLRLARQAGIRTTLRPLLSENTLNHTHVPRDKIQPRNIAAWFRSYGKIIAPYLKIAQADKASSFVIGTELVMLGHDNSRWLSLIAGARRTFHGRFLFEDRYKNYSLWAPYHAAAGFDADMWPGFTGLRNTATTSQLTRAWKKFLAAYGRKRSLRSLVISETGIAAVPGAYQHSATWFGVGLPTPQGRRMQERWYTALCTATRAYHVRGLYWWEINFTANPAAPAQWDRTDQFTFMGVPAQQAVASCFKSWSAGK
jgi:hypothetical protein